MCTNHIIFGKHPPGHKDAGLRYVDLAHGLASDKSHKLSLGQTSVREVQGGLFKITEDPSDPYDYVTILHFYRFVYLGADYEGPFFRRVAGKKELARRAAQGDLRQASFEPSSIFGKNYPTQSLKELARFCGFKSPEKVTGRSFRRWAITNLARKGVAAGVLLQHSRHKDKDIITNALYQESTKDQVAHLQRAKQYQVCLYSFVFFFNLCFCFSLIVYCFRVNCNVLNMKTKTVFKLNLNLLEQNPSLWMIFLIRRSLLRFGSANHHLLVVVVVFLPKLFLPSHPIIKTNSILPMGFVLLLPMVMATDILLLLCNLIL